MIISLAEMFLGIGLYPLLASAIEPMEERTRREAFFYMPTRIPDYLTLLELRRRKRISEGVYKDKMKELGYSEDWAEHLWETYKRLLTADQYLSLKWRGKITEEEYIDKMEKLGFSREEAKLFEEANRWLPSPSVIISWLAREVYEPEFIKKFGLEEGFDKIKKDDFYKLGITDEQIRNMWIAHWTHPSYTQIAEMYHRGLIDRETFWEWFSVVEIPPFWRDKLIELSHRLPTRVDIRRMYRMGVISEEEVEEFYRKLGYTEKDAKLLTEFTVKEAMEKGREISSAKIRDLFMFGLIKKKEAVGLLKELGYSEREANLLITLWEFEEYLNDLLDTADTYITLYKKGIISETELKAKLDELNLPSVLRDDMIRKASRVIARKTKLPSKEDIKELYKKRKIKKEEAVDYLVKLGYQDHIARKLVEVW